MREDLLVGAGEVSSSVDGSADDVLEREGGPTELSLGGALGQTRGERGGHSVIDRYN